MNWAHFLPDRKEFIRIEQKQMYRIQFGRCEIDVFNNARVHIYWREYISYVLEEFLQQTKQFSQQFGQLFLFDIV